jgi:hypothetical protein
MRDHHGFVAALAVPVPTARPGAEARTSDRPRGLAAVDRRGTPGPVPPRWQFTNVSADIRALCCWALDLVGVAWRQSNHKTISVSRREAVAALDELIGLKA